MNDSQTRTMIGHYLLALINTEEFDLEVLKLSKDPAELLARLESRAGRPTIPIEYSVVLRCICDGKDRNPDCKLHNYLKT